ncbi:MAG: hypothetical protein ACI8VC_002684 [Candidatus Endobugula sp.]|jgi:hypothetical protein
MWEMPALQEQIPAPEAARAILLINRVYHQLQIFPLRSIFSTLRALYIFGPARIPHGKSIY